MVTVDDETEFVSIETCNPFSFHDRPEEEIMMNDQDSGTRDDDLDAQLQLLTAYHADPVFRPVAVAQAQSAEASILSQFETSATFASGRDLAVRLHDGDKRWSLAPSAADLAKGTAADLPELLKSALAAPINLVIVGDMSVDKAIAAAQATIGALRRSEL